MFKKLNKKGFTLAELLIVVAIIGVLVAVSIPIFTAQLKKAKRATNMANARSIYAMLVADYMDDNTVNATISGATSGTAITYTNDKAEVTVDGQKFEFTAVDSDAITFTWGTNAPTVTVVQDGTTTNFGTTSTSGSGTTNPQP